MPQTINQRDHLQNLFNETMREEKLRAAEPQHRAPTRSALYLLIPIAVALCVGAFELGRAFVAWAFG